MVRPACTWAIVVVRGFRRRCWWPEGGSGIVFLCFFDIQIGKSGFANFINSQGCEFSVICRWNFALSLPLLLLESFRMGGENLLVLW
ncbi:hypothetical protein ACKS0A_05858 [Histoplasma ohiense]